MNEDTRAAFEAWFDRFGFDRAEYPERFSAWEAARQAYRHEALEEAAKACDAVGDDYAKREGHRYPELKSDAQTGARDCEAAIRALATPPVKGETT